MEQEFWNKKCIIKGCECLRYKHYLLCEKHWNERRRKPIYKVDWR
jgi:hypothetical protein